ncbi:hypothetical protein NRW27_000427 [Salmonella enterica]|nr:hypothetical protein [Salmonella enterica subsp. enterica serovar Oranienburg]EEI8241877.1 hypothetical protein [Salmonella enterica subsp. enterica serovar 4,[5],12:i:-]EJN7610614.1 hypothetical protein [Salmonella enterica]ELC9809112.1 hypothetical protein [Salmonella enterica]
MSRPSSDTIFQLHYSYYIEIFTYILLRRITRLLWFIQIIAACAVMTNALPAWISGSLMIICTYFLCAYRTHGDSIRAAIQACRYSELISRSDELTDNEIKVQLRLLEYNDSSVMNVFLNPAYYRACIRNGVTPETRPLTRTEKLFAALAGGIPQ